MFQCKGSRPGFTLLEAIIALAVLAVALTMTLQAFSAELRAQRRLRVQLEAVALADWRISQVATLPADSLRLYSTIREGTFDPPFERFKWRALVRADPAAPSLVQAAVLVEWKGGDYSIETFLYRPDRLRNLNGIAQQ